MYSRKSLVYTFITAVVLISVVLISVFVKPSNTKEFEENKPEKRSEIQDEPLKTPKGKPEAKPKTYLGKDKKKFPWQKIRLPTNIEPLKYRVELHPNLKTFNFNGNVKITVKCVSNTDKILIHAKHMELTKIKVANINNNDGLNIVKISESNELEMCAIEMEDQLKADQEYIIYIEFKAALSDKLFGFYKSSYKNKNGDTRYLATTHFEPTDARAAFPCFDEPALKAKFEIILIRRKGYTALSNMPKRKTVQINEDGSLLKDYFQETVKMSTYLIAFVVCDFDSLSARTESSARTLVRVWAPPDEINQGQFALDAAKKILHYYETFFKVDFPLPKLDLIAIPDFAAGAMENWGLITYRLTSLLYNEKESSDSNKQWVATVVAHELAHQWFGNLVTMKWWNDLWLNEGFASFVENIGANNTNPEWKMMDQFLLDKTQLSMNLDQMSNSHPISVRVDDPNDINSLFDTISYDKGAAIIRMLKDFIGDNAFKHGLQNYLKDHHFDNAETNDLWSELSKAAKIYGNKKNPKVKDVMDTWTLQMGFPVVNIRREQNMAIASQEHFLVHPKANVTRHSKFGYKWLIPLTYRIEKEEERKQIWMNKDNNNVNFDWPVDGGWVKVNYGQQGFYRVNYEEENWKKLRNQLNTDHKAFSSADRAGLLDDAFNLARAGHLNLTAALDLTLYLTEEKEYVPWSAFLTNAGYIRSMLCLNESIYPVFKRYMLQQLTPIVNELGWKDEGTHLQKYLRSSVLSLASEYGHKEATQKAVEMFKEWREHGTKIPPNLRVTVYNIGMREGGEVEFDHVYHEFKNERVASEKKKLMYALASTRDPKLLERLLKMSLNTAEIRSQDTVGVITSVASNCKARKQAWQFVKDNWKELFNRYGTGSFDFSRLILRTSSHFNTKKMEDEIKGFFKTHNLASAERAGKQSLESIVANKDWVKTNGKKALIWLIANTRTTPPQKTKHGKPKENLVEERWRENQMLEDRWRENKILEDRLRENKVLEDRFVDFEDSDPNHYGDERDLKERPGYQNERAFAGNSYYQAPREGDGYNDGYFRDSREIEDENDYGYTRDD